MHLVSFRGQVHPQPEESLKFTNFLSLRDPSDALGMTQPGLVRKS